MLETLLIELFQRLELSKEKEQQLRPRLQLELQPAAALCAPPKKGAGARQEVP